MFEKSTAGKLSAMADQVAPQLEHAAEQAGALLKSGIDSVRETSQQVSDRAQHASSRAVHYIKDDPIKSILIAAATGAALMALIGLVNRSHHRD